MPVSTSVLTAFRLDRLHDPAVTAESVVALRELLADPYADPLDGQLHEQYDVVTLPADVHGALAFYYFSRLAERWDNRAHETDDRRLCNQLLEDPRLRDTLKAFYRLPEKYLKGTLTLYKVGTTSFILGIQDVKERADPETILKLVKPRHFRNPTICAALQETITKYNLPDFEDFIPEYDEDLPVLKPVEIPGLRRFLAMRYVKGDTVREALENAAAMKPRARAQECLRLARIVAAEVCSHLNSLRQYGLHHLDLSPDNLILNESKKADSIRLIDFGINHVLRGAGTTSSADVIRASRYVAPELLAAEEPSRVAVDPVDPYSLGMILIELLAGCDADLRNHDAAAFLQVTAGDVVQLLDRLRSIDFDTGMKLEALVDRNPKTRGYEDLEAETLYRDLALDLDSAFARFETAASRRWSRPVLRRVEAIDTEAVEGEGWLSAVMEVFKAMWDEEQRRTKLLTACRGLSLLLFFMLLYEAWDSARDHWSTDWSDALPGWTVALTFAFVATKYYQSIFAGISSAGLNGPTDWLMRLNAVSYFIPIWYTLAVDPRAWALCSAIGMSFVSANNYLTMRLARRATIEIQEAQIQTPMPVKQAAFLDRFEGWGTLTLWYVFALLVVHLLVTTHVLHDDWFYAAVVTFLNAKMFWYNCTTEAPAIRMGLRWLFENDRRARPLLALGPGAKAVSTTT